MITGNACLRSLLPVLFRSVYYAVGTWTNAVGSSSVASCNGCEAGNWLNGDKQCESCFSGETSPVNSTTCLPCPAGQYTNNNQSDCVTCPCK